MVRRSVALFVILLSGACQTVSEPSQPKAIARADLRTADGSAVGTARLEPRGDGVALVLALSGLPAGTHGIHLHAVGKCEGPGFTTAGGHLNPAGHQHGRDNPAGAHLGDLPNIVADASGRVETSIQLGVEPGSLATALFDADGAALVIHATADDYKTDPSGNSGARIACGVLTSG